MSRRKQSSQVSFEDSERIALSHAIETILGSEDKENSTSQPHLRTSLPSLEFSNIEKTPHDGTLDKSSSRQHCRKLDDKDTTPKKRHEPKKHLNSVNILCRSKKRKLEEKFKESGSSMKERMSRMSNILHSTPNVRQYGPLHPIPDANIHVLDPLGSGDSGVMVKDASGKLHPAEFVPVMVEERNGGFFMSPNINNNVSRTKESLHENKGQDDSLTNITWLKRMSAPGVSPGVDSGHQSRTQSADPHCERPPYSYSALIQFALISTPVGKMTLKEIYDWIQTNFPFFKTAKLGWKNSIRHNLSLHKIFIREPPDGPGKPAYWTLRPGTVVRLPENRLFVMEGKSGENCLQGIPRQYSFQTTSGSRACIKQADGTTQVISEHLISAPHKPKPILPRVSQSYTFVSMPLLSSAGVNGLSDESNMSRKRFQRIAPKQVPCNMQRFYIPSTSDSGIDMGLFDTPKRKSSQTREVSVPVEKNRDEANSVGHCNPIMSTPLKPSKSSNVMEPSSSLMESMGNFTPFKDIDYDLLRAGDLLDITPIKESGMTPIIKGVLSKGLDMTPIPTGRSRQPSITTPVVVERNEMSFDLEDLFAGSESADGIDLANYSFSNLFSPVSKK